MRIRTRPDQDEALKTLAKVQNRSVPKEAQVAIDAHLVTNKRLIAKQPKRK